MHLAHADEGPGPVVLLLHGFPFNRSMWSAQLSSIGSTYRVIAPDLRGHGESDAPGGDYTMDEMADDVIELLDQLHIQEQVVLGGLSMGGYVALSLITRYPERFRALMLMDTRAGADSTGTALAREEQAKLVEKTNSVEPVVSSLPPKLFSPISLSRRLDQVELTVEMMEQTTPRGVAGALRGMAKRPDRTSELGQIQVPTLILVGADDQVTPPSEAEAMARAIPNAQLVIIPEAGHLAPMENASACNEAILRFLSNLRP